MQVVRTRMAPSDILGPLQSLLNLALTVQQTGERWYSTAAAYQRFKENIRRIEGALHSWDSLVEKYGFFSKEEFANRLEQARQLLEEEKAKLESLNRRNFCWFLFQLQLMLNWTSFPSTLNDSIEFLTNTISAEWKADHARELAAAEKLRADLRRDSWKQYPFREDELYERLPNIEHDIQNALNDQSMKVILLEGRAGMGKSCMARHLARECRRSIVNASKVESSPTAASVSQGSMSTSGSGACEDYARLFDQVLFLECGPWTDIVGKQKELLHLLGSHDLFLGMKDEKGDLGGDLKTREKAVLERLLRKRKLLIIFDDVWEDELLEDILHLCQDAHGVKMLVTSQKLGLCRRRRDHELCARISMSVSEADAQRILERHTGFTPGENISEPIQNCVARLIRATSTNPHVLASMATAIDPERRDEEEQWETVILGREEILGNPVDSAIEIQGTRYSSSIAVKFQRLNAEEMSLMILMSMLEGPSVPECVVQLLSSEAMVYGDVSEPRISSQFSVRRRNLQGLRCVAVTKNDGRYFWSIHFLDSEFLLKTRADDAASMLAKFQNLSNKKQGLDGEQEHSLKLIAAFYFKRKWADEVMTGTPFSSGGMVIDRPRHPIQDILILMLRNIVNDWSVQERSAADQVLLSFLFSGTLHEVAVHILLSSTISAQVLVDTIIKVVEVTDLPLSEGLVMDLLAFKGDFGNEKQFGNPLTSLNMGQCELLSSIAWRGGNSEGHFVRWSLCREKIVAALFQTFKNRSNDPDLRTWAIDAVGGLGWGFNPDANEHQVSFLLKLPLLLSELNHVLEDDMCPKLQRTPAWTLYVSARWARYKECLSIIETTGYQLARCLHQTKNITLQRWVLQAFYNLSVDLQTSLKIMRYPHAINDMLAIVDSSTAIAHSVRAIVNSAYTVNTEDIKGNDVDIFEVRVGAASTLSRIVQYVYPSSVSSEADSELIKNARACIIKLLSGRCSISESENRSSLRGEEAVRAFTFFYPVKAAELRLHSLREFYARAKTWIRLGKCYDYALRDLTIATQRYRANKDTDTDIIELYLDLAKVKAKLGDWDGAIEDADQALDLAKAPSSSSYSLEWWICFCLQERGVLKHIMNDLDGALKDLDEGLRIYPNDYELLKHRGFVKFLMGDADGAQKDAKEAIPFKQLCRDDPPGEAMQLGASIVEFLGLDSRSRRNQLQCTCVHCMHLATIIGSVMDGCIENGILDYLML